MSKLIKMYKNLKTQNSKKIYLFKSGIFYIFLDEDAREMSKALAFKLTNLNDEFVKCGFPSNSFDKYMNLINKLNYDVEIVNSNNNVPYFVKSYSNNLNVTNLLNEIISIDVDTLSIRDAYSILDKLKKQDKVINHLVARHILYPSLIPCLLDVNVASRENYGTSEGIRLAKKFHQTCKIKYGNYYILKCDISKFFASIDHNILKNKLKRKIKDKSALKIVFDIIDMEPTGLSIGAMTSQVLAIFFFLIQYLSWGN